MKLNAKTFDEGMKIHKKRELISYLKYLNFLEENRDMGVKNVKSKNH